MSEVVLVEGRDPDGPRPAAPPRHPLRRPLGRRLALLAAAALAGSLVAEAAADQARIVALDAVPGAIRPTGGTPRPLWSLDEGEATVLDSGTLVGGVLVGAVGSSARQGDPPGMDATALVGLDADTGARRWSLPLTPPADLEFAQTWAWCAAAAGRALCSAQAWGNSAGDTWQRAWLLSPLDGTVVREWPVGGGSAVGTVGDVVVEQSGLDADGRPARDDAVSQVTVTGRDPSTGAALWSWRSPPGDRAGGARWGGGWSTGGRWLVSRGEHAWLLDAAGGVRQVDGLVGGAPAGGEPGEAVDSYVDVARGGGLVETVWLGDGEQGPDQVWYYPERGHRRGLPGSPLWLAVDDGSAPGVLPVSGERGGSAVVAGVAVATGDVLWSRDLGATQALLVDGRLVLLATAELVALDPLTGAVLWTAGTEPSLRGLSTDGEVVLVTHGNAVVEAFALSDGRPAWRRDLAPAAAGAGDGGEDAGRPGAWVRLDTPLPHPVVMRPDGVAVVMG